MATSETINSEAHLALEIKSPPRHRLRLIGFLLGINVGFLALSLADNGRIVPQTRVVTIESQALANVALRQVDRIGVHMPHVMLKHWARGSRHIAAKPQHRKANEAWYVFLPPGDRLHENPDPSAPFKRWAQGEAFDDAQSCEIYRNQMLRETNHEMARETDPQARQLYLYRAKSWTYADCLSARDRRIEEAR